MKTFIQYVEQYALLSLEKRHKLSGLVADEMHELDLEAGTVLFSSGLVIPYQVLGTESDHTLTWLWAWAEEQTEIPEDLLQTSLDLRAWGMREGLHEFTVPSVDLDRADGNSIALIATEIAKANSFFRDVYDGGSALLLLFDNSIDVQPGFDRKALFQELSGLAALYDLDQRNVLRSYLVAKQLSPTEDGALLSCELDTGERIIAEFNERDKIINLNGESFSSY
jgi:hypothetical protein